MKSHKTIKQLLEEKDNDYSLFEPFDNLLPIPSSIIIPVYNKGNIFRETMKNISRHANSDTLPLLKTKEEALRETRGQSLLQIGYFSSLTLTSFYLIIILKK